MKELSDFFWKIGSLLYKSFRFLDIGFENLDSKKIIDDDYDRDKEIFRQFWIKAQHFNEQDDSEKVN